MSKKFLLFSLAFLMVLSAQAQFKGALGKLKEKAEETLGGGGLSQEEVGKGLKEALNVGVTDAVDFLSATDGYYKSAYKIVVPEEAQVITSKLKNVPGFGDVEEKLMEKMNRAAELAAKKATPIFISAIKQMTFKDAINILMGEKNAATQYLNRTTHDALFGEFQPVIHAALEEVNALQYWSSAVTAYNRLPLVKKANPELDNYVTEKALFGMFGLVEEKEKDIRANPALRTSDLLKKVFGKQDEGK